jgi:hypothetical protein
MNTPFLTRHYRRTRLAAVTCLACVGLLLMGNVQAQWKVVDDAGNKHLQNIRDDLGERNGNVNKNLVNLYNQQKLGTAKSAGAIAKDPEELLDANSPSTVNIGIDDRCPETPTAGIAQQQHQICQEMVKTELAQYKYSLQMYQQAKDRHSRFQEIENDRSQPRRSRETSRQQQQAACVDFVDGDRSSTAQNLYGCIRSKAALHAHHTRFVDTMGAGRRSQEKGRTME